MIALNVNGKTHEIDVPADKPLLWVLREDLNIVGPKFGCGIGQCRACTVHLDGQAMPSCQVTAADVAGKQVVTIEGLSDGKLHAVQQAWIAEQVPQCGYCQPGFIMATAALLREKPKPTDKDIDEALLNICRCGTYSAIRRAVHRAAATLGAL